jgi:hypothetical protein
MRAAIPLLLLLVALPALASESVMSHGRKKDDTLLGYFAWFGNTNQVIFYNNGETHEDNDCLQLWSSSLSDTITTKGDCKTDEEASLTFPRDVVVTQFSVFNTTAMQYGGSFQSCVVRLQKYEPTTESYTALASYERVSTSTSGSDNTVGVTDSQTLNALIPAGELLQFSSVDGTDLECPVPSSGKCICFGGFQSVISVYGYTK